jgi:hypothetical protein
MLRHREPVLKEDVMTRGEHLAWCKERALKYADRGDVPGAVASMRSDMGKHPDTSSHRALDLMVMLAPSGEFERPGELRKFIEGFS